MGRRSWLTWPAKRVIYDRNGKSPYLTRWTILRMGSFRVFVHKFHRGDDEFELHNHPWSWAWSLILWGGYLEERREADDSVSERVYRPGMLNSLRANTFHRVDLRGRSCWSLFVAGPRVQDWGFWRRTTGEFWPWREFISRFRDPGGRWDDARRP